MIINNVEYLEKTIRRWKQLQANLQFALNRDWIPILSDLEVEPELIEAGYPNLEGKEVEYVECPFCEKQYKLGAVYYLARHKIIGCEGIEK